MTLSIESSSFAQQQRCESWMGMAGCPMCCARCLDEGIMRYFRQFQVTHGSYNPFFVYLISTFGFCESFSKQRCKKLAPFTGDQTIQVQWPTTARRLAHLQQRDLKEWNREIQVLSQRRAAIGCVESGVERLFSIFVRLNNVWLWKNMLEAACEWNKFRSVESRGKTFVGKLPQSTLGICEALKASILSIDH